MRQSLIFLKKWPLLALLRVSGFVRCWCCTRLPRLWVALSFSCFSWVFGVERLAKQGQPPRTDKAVNRSKASSDLKSLKHQELKPLDKPFPCWRKHRGRSALQEFPYSARLFFPMGALDRRHVDDQRHVAVAQDGGG